MNMIRRKLLRAADQVILAGAHGFKFFGFLGSDRERVEIHLGDEGDVARFSDLAEEGWPGFDVPLPEDASFGYANASILSRIAIWHVPVGVATVVRELEERAPELRFVESSDGTLAAELAGGITVRLAKLKGATMLAVKQERTAESIADVIRSRTPSWSATRNENHDAR